jgi:hypothetical protein
MWKASEMKRRWFMCVNERLVEISVMRRNRDRAEISEAAKRAMRNFQFSRWAIRRGHRMILKTARREKQKIQVSRKKMR